MKARHLLLPFIVTPLCLAMWGCNDSDNDKTAEKEVLPILGEASPASLNSCEDLTSFKYADTVITDAHTVAAGPIAYNATESYTAPAHCVITGYMNDRTGRGIAGDTNYRIGFEMRLPVDWNGRFYYQANGGLDGSVSNAVGRFMSPNGTDASAITKGFAVISSDAGHAIPAPMFGLDPQARQDYGYNAVAELTPMAKSLIETAYGKQPDRSYFGGCSNGGRHTMVAATRFADQYDGFLVGNPGFNLPKAAVDQMYGIQQYASLVHVDQNNILTSIQSAITKEEFGVVSKAVVAQCDALDGAADGMINALEACQIAFDFDRDVPVCSGERDGTCLTQAQKEVLANIAAGAHNSAGEEIYTNFPYDAGMGTDDYFNWEYFMAMMRDPGAVAYIFTTPATVLGNTEADAYNFIMNFSMDNDAPKIYATDAANGFTEAGMDFMPPVDPSDMSTLRARGAKILAVHGTSDPVFSVQDTINWYNALQAEHSNQADEFARLYLVPGMNHCGRGPTTDKFDALDKLVTWVEDGTAPEEIVASVRANNAELPADWSTSRTRPLCPYPQVATYNGTGSIEDAANFSCKVPE
ncbi:tannase/feruloyl esterase family alpha/beta hydrolase [Shewanella avicenniae]|uniref:Tannase/feruloyl esterase family alpha/beta hydrolase n=1 Tax=Shewanella avicenniae TaxID=2814294 RepID=A0ABX7QR32_9GAMM|nr:tannase/feruloyl esterase family alpha/beta hydrolase [Shewanella avicenniae]QSX33864.1 tannase/feruloyl esterase family alpha/beta hydrolase [Shewanella avicenniae]